MGKMTLKDFAIAEMEKPGIWGQVFSVAARQSEFIELLAAKAISNATLSQRDRWQIAELLTGKKYTEPKRRGRQSDPDDDIRLFKRFCDIAAEIEHEGNTKPKKIMAVAYGKLTQEEFTKKHEPDESTIRKAVERGIYESIRRKKEN